MFAGQRRRRSVVLRWRTRVLHPDSPSRPGQVAASGRVRYVAWSLTIGGFAETGRTRRRRRKRRRADLFCILLRVNYGRRGAVARRAERKHDLSLRVAKDLRPRHGGKRAEETEQRIDTAASEAGRRRGSDDLRWTKEAEAERASWSAFPRRFRRPGWPTGSQLR